MSNSAPFSPSAPDAEWQALEFQARQLFSPAAPINAVDLFSGRKDQIKRFIGAVADRGRHVVLYGERGVGKTSLASIFHLLIGGNNQGKSMLIPIRKQASPEDDYSSLWKKVFRDLTYTVKEDMGYGKENDKIFSIADSYKEKITSDDVARELQRISLPVVIIFDEFDKIQDIETKKLMSHTIKLFSDLGVNSTIIIVGVADDINTLVDEHESVKRNLEEIKMPRMSKEELTEILSKRLSLLKLNIQDDALSKVINLSRGLPEYVHALGRNAALSAINLKKMTIDDSDIDTAIKCFLQQSDQSSNNAFKKATHSNKGNALYNDVLLACALAETDEEGRFTPTAVMNSLTKILNRKINISHFQAHLSAFCEDKRGKILEKHGTTRAFKYQFHEPKMQPYVIMQGIIAEKVDKSFLNISSPA